MTRRFLTLAVGCLLGSAGAAMAHDMASMGAMPMGNMPAGVAPVERVALLPDTIAIDNFAFGPQVLTVAAGTTVTWINHDDEIHTVISADAPGLFKSLPLDTGDKFSFTFKKPGTYRYFCSIHPQMTGTVVVK